MVMVYGSEKEHLWFMVNGSGFMINGSWLMVKGSGLMMNDDSGFMVTFGS